MNKIKQSLDKIHASDELVNKTKNRITDIRFNDQKKYSSAGKYRKVGISFALGLIILFTSIYIHNSQIYAAFYISIDVNPSLELIINEDDRVIDAKAYNDEAVDILETIYLNDLTYTEAIEKILTCDKMIPYLTESSNLVTTVTGNNETKISEIKSNIYNCQSVSQHHAKIKSCHLTLLDEAHNSNLSVGKYSEYLKLKEFDQAVTVEKCHEMTMEEIEYEIDCHQNQHENSSDKNHHHHE